METLYKYDVFNKFGNGIITICFGIIRHGKTMYLAKIVEAKEWLRGNIVHTSTLLHFLPRVETPSNWLHFLIKHDFLKGLEVIPARNLKPFTTKKSLLLKDISQGAIFASEISTMFPAKENIEPIYMSKFSQGGKDSINWYLDTQRPNSVNRAIRELATNVYFAYKEERKPFAEWATDGNKRAWVRKFWGALSNFFYSIKIEVYENPNFLDNSDMIQLIKKGEFIEELRERQEEYREEREDTEQERLGKRYAMQEFKEYKPVKICSLKPEEDGKRYSSAWRVLPSDYLEKPQITPEEKHALMALAEKKNRENMVKDNPINMIQKLRGK